MNPTHRLVVKRDLSVMPQVARFVDDVAQQDGWHSGLVFPVQLCLEEAISNVIRHGVVHGAAAEIRVSLGACDEKVVAQVEDDGEAFDPTGVAPPPRARSLPDILIGGLGINLMRRFAARVSYTRLGPSNRLTLEFGNSA